jgi:hypothetical protein
MTNSGKSKVYSGYIGAQQGFSAPAPFAGPPGWTVFKQQQTEIYVVQHNLALVRPEAQLHVTVTAHATFVLPVVSVSSNSFTVSTWQLWAGTPQAPAPIQSDFMFVAVFYPH